MQSSASHRILFKGSRKSKYSSVLTIFYKIIHVVFCLDFGFFEQKCNQKRVIWKSITVLYAIMITGLCYFLIIIVKYDDVYMHYAVLTNLIFHSSHYFMNVIALVSLKPNKTFCQFLRDLEYIDTKLGVENSYYNIEFKIMFVFILNFIFICAVGLLSVPYNINNEYYVICSGILLMVTSYCAVYVTCTFVYCSLNYRLKTYTSILGKQKQAFMYSMQLLYKSIADMTEKYKSAFDALFTLTLLFTTLEVMGEVVEIANDMKTTITVKFSYAGLLVHLMSMFAPALYAEMIAAKANDVKIILYDILLDEKDSTRQRELERFIRYVEARPLRFRVYRVIPLDASLLGMVLNFIVTYIIVILQFLFKK